VLFIGNDVFIGLSRRTNMEAIEQVREFLGNEVNVYALHVLEGLHLKSVVTGFDMRTLIVAQNRAGEGVVEEMKGIDGVAERYEFVFVPDDVAGNVLRLNDTLIVQDGFPRSEEVLGRLCMVNGVKMVKVNMSEFIKADGSLTCCSVPMFLE